MLLACPNCDARYDVPDDAIPENGRDVQCSNCGHAWFQLPVDTSALDVADDPLAPEAVAVSAPDRAAEPVPPPAPFNVAKDASAEREPIPAPVTASVTEPEPKVEPAPAPARETALSGTEALKAALTGRRPAETTEAVTAATAAPPVRRELDDEVLSILRDEAEREASARKAEAQRSSTRRAEAETGLQSQPELSMPAPTPEMTAQQKRLAMLRGEDLDDDPEPTRPVSRRDLLPDVEEINSTLQPDDGRFDPDAEVDALPDLTRGSFRTGFLLAVLVLVIAALVYVFAGRIATTIPALEASLQAYVSFVDGLRSWLNTLMDSATQALTSDEGPAG